MKKIAIAVIAALISGCATQPQPLPIETKIPVMVSCVKPEEIPVKPDYESLKDTDSTPDGTLVLHITRDFSKSISYGQQLEVLITACK